MLNNSKFLIVIKIYSFYTQLNKKGLEKNIPETVKNIIFGLILEDCIIGLTFNNIFCTQFGTIKSM